MSDTPDNVEAAATEPQTEQAQPEATAQPEVVEQAPAEATAEPAQAVVNVETEQEAPAKEEAAIVLAGAIYEGAMDNLQMHLQDLRSFLAGFDYAPPGKLGEIVAYLKANL